MMKIGVFYVGSCQQGPAVCETSPLSSKPATIALPETSPKSLAMDFAKPFSSCCVSPRRLSAAATGLTENETDNSNDGRSSIGTIEIMSWARYRNKSVQSRMGLPFVSCLVLV